MTDVNFHFSSHQKSKNAETLKSILLTHRRADINQFSAVVSPRPGQSPKRDPVSPSVCVCVFVWVCSSRACLASIRTYRTVLSQNTVWVDQSVYTATVKLWLLWSRSLPLVHGAISILRLGGSTNLSAQRFFCETHWSTFWRSTESPSILLPITEGRGQ
jgi:hypothetical protein